MQNLVVLVKTNFSYDIGFNAAKMCFNRFCIDEDAAFELSGVWFPDNFCFDKEITKGKGYPMRTIRAYKKFHFYPCLFCEP